VRVDLVKAHIAANGSVAKDTYLMELRLETEEFLAAPGQFVMLRILDTTDPLLRRAFSICSLIKPNVIQIMYRVVGKGTRLMKDMKEEETLELLGPLGNGFQGPERGKKAVLVSGGIGVAPLFFLASRLKPHDLKFIAGYGSKEDVVPPGLLGLEEGSVLFATEDGSCGYHGLVTELFEAELNKTLSRQLQVYCCGPWEMLKKLAHICYEYDLDCQVSLESAMACGVGACQGCAVKASASYPPDYFHVCSHGPVFSSSDIDWEG